MLANNNSSRGFDRDVFSVFYFLQQKFFIFYRKDFFKKLSNKEDEKIRFAPLMHNESRQKNKLAALKNIYYLRAVTVSFCHSFTNKPTGQTSASSGGAAMYQQAAPSRSQHTSRRISCQPPGKSAVKKSPAWIP
ncbi:MAG: hypothetical protein RSB39_09095 [Oscillospiraceae bacterium]